MESVRNQLLVALEAFICAHQGIEEPWNQAFYAFGGQMLNAFHDLEEALEREGFKPKDEGERLCH